MTAEGRLLLERWREEEADEEEADEEAEEKEEEVVQTVAKVAVQFGVDTAPLLLLTPIKWTR